jgi:hypothetical protein
MIVGAAVKRDEKVWTGWRHSHIIKEMAEAGACAVGNPVKSNEQGFVNQLGEFLTREEAFKNAVESGQLEDPGGNKEHKLTSEDLW